MGARNQLYYASLNGQIQPSMLPILTAMVNGTLKNKSSLIKTAKSCGLLDDTVEGEHLGGKRGEVNSELLVVLYEVLLGSRR